MNIQERYRAFVHFVGEVGGELKKSEWPARSELMESTVVVVVCVGALAAFVWVSDVILIHVLRLLMGR